MGASERQALEEKSPWWGEHVHRYQVALPYLRKTDHVLDIACGTGFGSHLLADYVTQGEVIGGDVSQETLDQNNAKFSDIKHLRFEYTDATDLQYDDDYFDAITSFETLEHVPEDGKMMQELRRVLKPNGVLVLSTPNIIINSPTGVVTNPFHVREYTLDELMAVIQPTFPDAEFYGQHYARYDKCSGAGSSIAKATESLLYQRGVRKLPIAFQDSIMQTLGGTPMYPQPNEYTLVDERPMMLKCKTFVVIDDGRQRG